MRFGKEWEHLATRLKLPENLIANQAVELVHEFLQTIEKNEDHPYPRQTYLAYYLLEPKGNGKLTKCFKEVWKAEAQCLKNIFTPQRPTSSYFNMIGGTFAVFLLLFTVIIGWNLVFSPIQWLVVLSVLTFPAMEWAITGVHWFIEKVKKPSLLLRYDFSREIPIEASTAVVIPVIWSSLKDVEELTDRLELHYLANKHQNLHFALLSDFADADSEHDHKMKRS